MDDSQDIDTLARTLYGEARGEGKQGMIAVACVVVTRAMIADEYMDAHGTQHPLYGDGSLSSACQMPLQFSCWNQGDPNRETIENVTGSDPSFLVALAIAQQAENDDLEDITDNATHYYAKGSPTPEWAIGKTACVTIGNHLFFNDID